MYNEEAVLPLLVERLRPVADGWGVPYEILCVDDGSTDATPVLLQRLHREWPQVRVLRLRANAGHQAAISAGLARARGRWMVTIDADLQDPPEVIGEMLAVARGQGVDVVYGVRSDRSTDTAFKRLSARAFYRSIRAMSDVDARVDAGDFRLMSRATVDAVNALPEHGRVLRLVVPALGFPSASVDYAREERAAGDSKYPLGKMIRLSIDGVTGFSIAPLRFATWLGLLGGAGRRWACSSTRSSRCCSATRSPAGRRRSSSSRRWGPCSCWRSASSASTWAAPTPRCRPARRTSSPTTRSTRGRTTASEGQTRI